MAIFDFVTKFFSTKEKRAGGYVDPSQFNLGGGSGVNVNPDTAMTFTAVWAAIRLLSESIGQLPISLCEKLPNGDKVIRSEHPLYHLLHHKPNAYMTAYVFINKIMTDLCTVGNSYVQIDRNGAGRPTQLIPIDAKDMTVKQYDDTYYYMNSKTGETYDDYDLLHFKGVSRDGLIGLSPIDTCASAISWGMGLEVYGNSYFKNGAKVSGVLQTDRALSTEAIDRLRNSFEYNYSKIGDANKTLILEEGLKFNTISLSNEASQFLSSRTFSVEEIARIFNIPPHLLRDLSKSSFSNITEQSREFVQITLMPYMVMMEQELNCKLFKQSEFGKLYFEFNVNALLRGNPTERAEYYKTMLNIGAMTINEIRQKENLNSIDNGDKVFMQLNMTTLDNIVDGVNDEENNNVQQTEY
tara:strand:- start:9243 stop:10475 length:1233 start_codon:yes stop_codon:yes gene_type:complete